MEQLILHEDIKTFYVTARSFPEGIQEAFYNLHYLLPGTEGRTFYGISHQTSGGNIVYKAAVAESFAGEAEKYGCETFLIRSGEYAAHTIRNWKDKITTVGTVFQSLLAHPQLDRSGACVEWYKSDEELVCMVRIR